MLDRLLHAWQQVLLAEIEQVDEIVRIYGRLAEVEESHHRLEHLERVFVHV